MKKSILFIVVLCSFTSCFNRTGKQHYDRSKINLADEKHAVLIFGGGVAGLTAANYLAQANVPCTLLEGSKPGGALSQSHSVRNWPGVLDAPGKQIIDSLKDQVTQNGVPILPARVTSINTKRWPYVVEFKNLVTGDVCNVQTLACVVATGAEPNYLGVAGEQDYWGKGVTNCAVCDGALFKGKRVAVVGGGDSAVVETLYLSRIAEHVDVLVRSDHFIAKDKKKLHEMLHLSNVDVHYKTVVKKIVGTKEKVTALELVQDGVVKNMKLDGVFLAIGAKPNTAMLQGQVELDNAKYIVLKHDQQTSVEGVFAAGDVCDPVYKQAVTSAADGCRAALQIEQFFNAINMNFNPTTLGIKKNKISTTTPAGAKNSVQGIKQVVMKDKQHLANLIAQSDNIIISVSAPLCISCQAMKPVVRKMIDQFSNKIQFVYADVSQENVDGADIATLISGKEILLLPTFIFVNKGKEVFRFEGEKTADQFEKIIFNHF